MRKFIILDEKIICGKVTKCTIVGFVESDYYPSYDKETAFKKYGVEIPKIVEVAEHCHCEII